MALFETKVKAYSPRLQKDCTLKGFQADGFFGNFGEETNGFTQLHQVGGNGRGWAQWDDRRPAFERWCSDHGLSPESDEGNYGYLVHELLTTENAALRAVQATRTRDDATRAVMDHFERPGVPALDVRIHWAIRAEVARLEQEKAMTDTPAPQSSQTEQQIDTIIKQGEALGNQIIISRFPAAAPIVELVENSIVNPFLPTIEHAFGAQIDANAAAHAVTNIVFSLLISGLGLLAGKFVQQKA